MSLPSTEEFSRFISLLRQPLAFPRDWFGSITYDEILSPEQVMDFFTAADTIYSARKTEILETPTSKWLDASRDFQRAQDMVYGRRKRKKRLISASTNAVQAPSLDDEVNHHFAQLTRIHESGTDIWKIGEHQKKLLDRRLIPPGTKWLTDSVTALSEYFEGSTSKRMVELARKHRRAASALERSIIDYLDVIGPLNAMQTFEEPVRLTLLAKKIQHQVTVDALNIAAMPITRIDDTSDERLFVYRMNLANRRHSGTPKTEAIACLMNMDGFRHQYDKRTIEKLCADFTGTREALKARNAPGRLAEV